MLEDFSSKAGKYIAIAESLAFDLGHCNVGSEHLLLSFLKLKDNKLKQILEIYKVDYEVVKKDKVLTKAQQDILRLKENDVVLLIGDLSAGKTTFTKGIGQALGVKRVINSPTFTIVKEYSGDELKLYHLDLYRLDGVNNDFDLEEYFTMGGISVIEWPYQVREILPNEYVLVTIERINEEERKIIIETVGSKYDNLFEE